MWSKFNILWRLMRGQRARYVLALAALGISTGAMYFVPMVGRAVIDYVLENRPLDAPQFVRDAIEAIGGRSVLARNLWTAAAAMAAVSIVSGAFAYLRGRWSAQASEDIARRLRDRLYDHLQRLRVGELDRRESGDLVQRCTSDVETIRVFLADHVVDLWRGVIMLAVAVPLLLSMDLTMAAVSLVTLPVLFVFSAVFFARVQYSFKEMDEAEGRMTAILQENLWGIRVVRAFARQEHERAKFGAGNRTYRDLWYRMIELMSWYWPISNMLTMGQQGLVLVVGGYFVAEGRISIGTLYAYLAYVGMMLWPIRMLGRMLMDLGKALVSIGRVSEILDAPVEEDSSTGVPPVSSMGVSPARTADVPSASDEFVPSVSEGETPSVRADGTSATRPQGRIVVRDLYFSHASVLPVQKQEHGRDAHATRQEHGRDAHATADAHAMVLEGVSLSVEPGQTLAIMGPSGAGKSTLVSLLLRFYDYSQGSITLDGVELSSLSRHEVRSRIGVVLQEPFLYSRTLRENIKHGRTRAADEEMIAAASAAGVHEAIVQFERGYDTLVGERGVTLSGGQRQRVAIARALLKDPPVLILDDALSSVDTQTEAAILAALEQRRGRRTTIVIAHRLATLMRSDRIVVLDRGRIVQNGTHAQLLQQDGLYRRLWEIQNRLDEDLATAEETA